MKLQLHLIKDVNDDVNHKKLQLYMYYCVYKFMSERNIIPCIPYKEVYEDRRKQMEEDQKKKDLERQMKAEIGNQNRITLNCIIL